MRFEFEFEEQRENHKVLRFNFITVELDLAMTFCQRAVSTRSEASARRNVSNARRAYRVASRAFKDSDLSAAMKREVKRRIELLKPELAKLSRNHARLPTDVTLARTAPLT